MSPEALRVITAAVKWDALYSISERPVCCSPRNYDCDGCRYVEAVRQLHAAVNDLTGATS